MKGISLAVLVQENPYYKASAQNNRMLTLVEGLSVLGCQIKIYILGGFINKKEKAIFGNAGMQEGILYEYLSPMIYPHRYMKRILHPLLSKRIIKKNLSAELPKKKYDYIWVGICPFIGEITNLLLKLKDNSIVLHERSEYSWVGLNPKKHEQYINTFLPFVDIFLPMTKTLEKYYKEYIRPDCSVLHLPMTVDFSRFSSVENKSEHKKPYIAYCGTMSNKKDGVDILILAFIKIMNKFPELNLYLAGQLAPGEDVLLQKNIIKSNNAEKRVLYTGNLTRGEIPDFLLNAKILAMARPQSKQAEGGFPTKLGEYLATGNPVCATTVGEINMYLQDEKSAYLAKPGSVESFADALQRALMQKKAKDVGETGKQIALEHFNKEKQAKDLFLLLKSKIK